MVGNIAAGARSLRPLRDVPPAIFWRMLVAVAVALLAAAFALLFRGVNPVPALFYLFAWYPALLLFDGLAARADGRPLALSNRRALVSVWLWSAPVWLFFEAA